ncbi:glycosyltransferase family 2 protein [Halonotius terrestris]|uniref:Glycosyltransferase family 2 protein n=1 Tax=Halonotius terrestris TaxID=2487750 RepID=A0A8J8P9R4_9EURY|nr:glycosyltransferase family A protein [Halonotius terrestris]TQQ82829.1 glycosyltransferase family 2 protein [Halonotius terrestris]
MQLSVVVPTLNGRDHLIACLDTLHERVPDAEVIVVNGPSTDGTTGMIDDRDDVDVLVEVSSRTRNVARNAGIDEASGDVIALLGDDLQVEGDWLESIVDGLTEAPVVTGPTHRTLRGGVTTESAERERIAGRSVTAISGNNVAFRREVIEELDGFDEYLETGGAWDLAHRLAAADHPVAWRSGMSVRCEYEADGGRADRDWGWKYRALAYRLVKNYGLRPTVARRTLSHAVSDAISTAVDVVKGEGQPTNWIGNGRAVLSGISTGGSDGLVARARDRSDARNPHGLSKRGDRAVVKYDWRDDGEPIGDVDT